MTRRVVAQDFGGPEQLQVIDEEVGAPASDEIRVDVRAIGVNPIDWKLYSGAFGTAPGNLTNFGNEASGVVAAIGSEVTTVAVGDRVVAAPFPTGAYADTIIVPARAVTALPDDVPFDSAAGAMLAGATAWHLLEATHVASGDTVLAHGAAGGVGTMLVQLARLRGATVVATASAANHDHLRALGATPVAYGDGLLDRVRAAAPGGVDVALDLVGTDEAMDTSLALVEDRDRIATIANFTRGPSLGIRVLGNGPGADPGVEVRAAGRRAVLAALADGSVTVPVSRTFALADTADAHRFSRDGHVTGKLVVHP